MQFKVKALVGMYQCLAAIPGVYNVNPPLGLEEYIRCVTCPCAFDGDVASSLLACPAALIVPRPDPEESSPAQFHCVRWMYLIEFPADLTNFMVNPGCVGSYQRWQYFLAPEWPLPCVVEPADHFGWQAPLDLIVLAHRTSSCCCSQLRWLGVGT
jgi:hypothetical protein